MILGIYLKSKPKSKWHLVSVSTSAEHANQEVNLFKEQATLNGYDEAEVAIQSFESSFWIPEYINEIKTQQSLLN